MRDARDAVSVLLVAVALLVGAARGAAGTWDPGTGWVHTSTPKLALVSRTGASEEILSSMTEEEDESEVSSPSPGKMLLLSLAVPGAGEIAQGKKRGYIFLLAEAAFWGGFYLLNREGLEERDEYEEFADAHWDCEGYSAWYDENCVDCSPYCPDDCRPLAPYGSQEYYEDVGKYQHYWRWWSYGGQGVDNPEWMEVRSDYWDMRKESNMHLRRARYLVMASFLNHVASGLGAFLTARGAGSCEEAGGRAVGFEFGVPDDGEGLSCAIVARF